MTVLGSLHFNTLRVRIYLTLVYYSGRCVYDPLTIEIRQLDPKAQIVMAEKECDRVHTCIYQPMPV